MRRNATWRLAAIAGIAVPLALLGSATVSNVRQAIHAPRPLQAGPVADPRPRAWPIRPSPDELRRLARDRCRVHLDRADAESRQALASNLQGLDAFFVDAKRRTPRFADRVLGWEGLWRLVADRLPGTDGSSHEAFLRRTFRDVQFTPEQLDDQARRVVRGYLDELRAIEGRMMVAIRRDVADLPTSLPIVTINEGRLRSVFERAMAEAAGHSGAGLRDDAARELVALAIGEVLTQAAVRGAASAGLLGAGAASSAVTFGVGLAAGLVVDQLVSWVWDHWADPHNDLARALSARIDELRRVVVEGTAAAPGLRPKLERWAHERAGVRRAAVIDLIVQEGSNP